MTKTQAAQKMVYGNDFAKRPTFRTGIDPFTGTNATGAYKTVKFGPNPVAKAAAKEIARSKTASGKIKETFNVKGLARRFKAQGGK